MATADVASQPDLTFAAHLAVHKMPAHWLMARLGKRVLRPGGVETTRWLLDHGRLSRCDNVVEFAPGLGTTAKVILAQHPSSYVAVERDQNAAAFAGRALAACSFAGARILQADATHVPLPDSWASVVVGEAMLSMQPTSKKRAIMAEARRLLRRGGRYLIHELGVQPEEIEGSLLDAIEQDLSSCIHVGVRIGTLRQWRRWLEEAGFEVDCAVTAPMHLLEPARLVHDEGVRGAARFVFNAVRTPGAARRLIGVRGAFRRHRRNLCAVGLVARAA